MCSPIGQFVGGGRREPAHRQCEGARIRQPVHPGQKGPGGHPGPLSRIPETSTQEGQVSQKDLWAVRGCPGRDVHLIHCVLSFRTMLTKDDKKPREKGSGKDPPQVIPVPPDTPQMFKAAMRVTAQAGLAGTFAKLKKSCGQPQRTVGIAAPCRDWGARERPNDCKRIGHIPYSPSCLSRCSPCCQAAVVAFPRAKQVERRKWPFFIDGTHPRTFKSQPVASRERAGGRGDSLRAGEKSTGFVHGASVVFGLCRLRPVLCQQATHWPSP